jgi:Cu2+-exporting ATPase
LLCRSARVIERVGEVTAWLFDKTGTLTEGRISIVRVERLTDLSEARCLHIASSLEAGIEHPIARALRKLADAPPAEAVEYTAGFGISGRVDGTTWHLGSARHVGHDVTGDAEPCIYLSDERQLVARFVLADRIRPHAGEALASLAQSSRVALVSGDSETAVAGAAQALGVDEYRAGLAPRDKLDFLNGCQAAGEIVAAVGDGINDAPFLARADVSIAIAAGSQLAQASADIVFTGDDLRTLAELPELARETRRVVRQNLAWAAAYNLTVIPLAALGLLMPWMAALGMSFSSLVVVGNSLRLSGLEPANRPTGGDEPDAVPVGGVRG